jgi:hypothetical protein
MAAIQHEVVRGVAAGRGLPPGEPAPSLIGVR